MKEGLNRKLGLFTPMRLVVLGVVVAAIVITGVYAWRMLRPSDGAVPEPAYWPTAGWQNSPPEAQGFDSAKLAEGLQAIKQNGTSVHSILIVRGGLVFLDAYFYPYDGSYYHDLASVTKSVMTTLIGIAADQGKLDLDQPMLSFFADRTIVNRDASKESITVRHLTAMTSGFEVDLVDDENTLAEMRASDDWVQFSLDRPVVAEPGSRFAYDGLSIHLLSAILQQATGMTAAEYAEANLFEPLGITDFYWPTDATGYTRGWGDLSLHPHDAAKIGFLFLHQGQWEGRQVVSREWVKMATDAHISTGREEDEYYGYGWWVERPDEGVDLFRADGRNGQRIFVIPSMNLVLVTTGGGFELDEVMPYMEEAIVDLENPLPSNDTGVTQLEAVVAELGQSPAAQPVPPLPDVASAVSGKTFVFQPNPAQIQSIRVDFDHPTEATYYIQVEKEEVMRIGGAGLDGLYRTSSSGWPAIAKVAWYDDHTLLVDYSRGPGLENVTWQIRFEGDLMLLETSGIVIEGELE
jgi:CubicO group peptidase (beta-lactamase class C family)